VLILSFAVSGGLSFLLFPKKPPPAASDPTGGSDAKDSVRLSGTPDRPVTPSDQQMDDTIRELRLRLAECDRRDRELERRQRRLGPEVEAGQHLGHRRSSSLVLRMVMVVMSGMTAEVFCHKI